LNKIKDKNLRAIRKVNFAYLRCDYDHVKQFFLSNKENDAIRLSVSMVTAAGAIATGDYQIYQEVESFLNRIVKENNSPDIKTTVEAILANGYLGAGALNMIPLWLKDGDFSDLPKNMFINALTVRTLYYRYLEEHELSLAVAETALEFYVHEKGLIHELTYLRLLSAAACCRLGRADEAKRYLTEAMDMNLPHGFISPFVECLYFTDGLLEQLLEQKYPQYYKAIISQFNQSYKNWIIFHNRFAKDNITLILTLREYQIAMLAARRVPRAKIAKQFNISSGRLNNIIGEIYSKLQISNQKELSEYVQ
jgi:DNA-binding CsgD family transcriptional regulator